MIMDIGVQNIPDDVLNEVKMGLPSAYEEVARIYEEEYGRPNQARSPEIQNIEVDQYGVTSAGEQLTDKIPEGRSEICCGNKLYTPEEARGKCCVDGELIPKEEALKQQGTAIFGGWSADVRAMIGWLGGSLGIDAQLNSHLQLSAGFQPRGFAGFGLYGGAHTGPVAGIQTEANRPESASWNAGVSGAGGKGAAVAFDAMGNTSSGGMSIPTKVKGSGGVGLGAYGAAAFGGDFRISTPPLIGPASLLDCY